jgi:DNA-3-methyladenine glycosylase
MRARRGRHDVRRLCSGPGRLTEALAVDGRLSGSELGRSGVVLGGRDGPAPRVASGPRIGITRAVERPWRFALEGSPFLSRPLPRTAAA